MFVSGVSMFHSVSLSNRANPSRCRCDIGSLVMMRLTNFNTPTRL
jgi:hypothetical protein